MVKISFFAFFAFSFAVWSNSPTAAKKLPELSEEVLHIIFDNLEILDLLHVVEADAAFQQAALWSFRHLQARKKVEISGRFFPYATRQKEEYNIRKGDGLILIQEYNMTVRVLSAFGNAIEKLDVDYKNMAANELAEIQRIIGEKCGNSLRHFGVSTEQPNYADLIPTVFQKVESVSLLWLQMDIDIGLNVKFPQMRSLYLTNILSENGSLIDHHFPHLNNFEFKLSDAPNSLNETHIERMLQKNPQVRSIITENPSPNFLQFLNESLPDMEMLQLNDKTKNFFSQNYPDIHFANVKTFTFHMEHRFFRDPQKFPLTFGEKLDEFKLVWCCDVFSSKWIEFFKRFAHVSYYSVEFAGRCREYPDLSELNISNVRELRLTHIDLDVFRGIFRQVKQQQRLETIHVIGLEIGEDRAIRNELNAEWRMNVLKNAHLNDEIDIILSKI